MLPPPSSKSFSLSSFLFLFFSNRFACGAVDPSSVQAGVILRTLLGCGAAASADKLGVLEQIQGSLIEDDEPPRIGDTLRCEFDVLEEIVVDLAEDDEEEEVANLRRLERTHLGGGDFVKSFPDLPDAERMTSAEIDKAFEDGVMGEVKVEKALFEHVEEALARGFVPVEKVSRNLTGIEEVLDGWQTAVDGLLEGDQAKNIPC